ncbi:MAG: flagellar basal body rod protein FlgC [Planctomycetota bacterium]
MYGALDIATSGMIAQRTRLDVISANIANENTLLNAQGEYDPFRRRMALLAPGNPSARSPRGQALGVQVKAIELDQAPFRLRYAPDSPHADASGYIREPNIDSTTEQIDAMEAVRAYEANVAAAEAIKSIASQGLRLLA